MTRPAHYDEYSDMTEVVPGVFVAEGSVYIVDDEGEVVCWVETEFQEDTSAINAALCAVALAAKKGAAAVRRNLQHGGAALDALIYETMEETEA